MEPPVFIHVGFGNAGTTSLQQNFFAMRDDIFFAGEPYGERGGIFTAIKSKENFKFDLNYFMSLCRDLIWGNNAGRPIVISDETFCDAPLLYFGPYMMPRDIIAGRLHKFFPSAKIIFTIRDQRHYAMSAYSNLKRNTAFFDHMPIPPFSTWLDGMVARERSGFLQNLNFMEAIGLYSALFGRDNICVLPLEMLVVDGPTAYLGKLCDFMGLRLTPADVSNYSNIRNRRMSMQRELAAELLHDDRFVRFYTSLSEHMGHERLEAFLDDGPRAESEMAAADQEKIRSRVGVGNWLLARQFGLDLARYGYPMADDRDFTARQLTLARREGEFLIDVERLRQTPQSAEEREVRRSAEMAQLREFAMQLMTVRQSPVWRTVERLDSARKRLTRAATLLLNCFH